MDALTVFAFVVWFWRLIAMLSDLFRRHDVSGWGKALWVIGDPIHYGRRIRARGCLNSRGLRVQRRT